MKVHESSTRDVENLEDSGSESDVPIMDIMKSIKASRETDKSNLSCKKSSRTKTMFTNAHKLSMGGAEASKSLDKCIKCKFKFVSEDEFINHVCKAVSDVYECEICFKQYKSRFALKEHKEISHQDNSLFICSICLHNKRKAFQMPMFAPNVFNSNGELVIHVRIHTGERPFPCKECEMAFFKRFRLTTTHAETHRCEEVQVSGL
ncbi:zinc finger protein 626-like [Ctenocephalides felis]|uniref:zinc finger protein 626-like n=1 Tax=Ctenocephalides felis TaxID=7515 RepID=UPI000E6E529D|nr:zinc finger protein 626-like [Ctenocephalides felis]